MSRVKQLLTVDLIEELFSPAPVSLDAMGGFTVSAGDEVVLDPPFGIVGNQTRYKVVGTFADHTGEYLWVCSSDGSRPFTVSACTARPV